jgi:hypothetical protein
MIHMSLCWDLLRMERSHPNLGGTPCAAQATWADGGGITGSWKKYMAESRAGFMKQLAKGDTADVFDWCMQVAAEDDALSTHSVRAPPVALACLRRVDGKRAACIERAHVAWTVVRGRLGPRGSAPNS